MHYFISAGEPSGDLHASHLISALRRLDPQARFTFLGGDMMAAAAGCEPVIHYRRMAYMGFSEVLRHLREIMGNLSVARKALGASEADALIVVDLPSFNLKLAREAVKLGIPVYYYIAPKVWAWKEWRVKSLRKYVRKVLSILPFEEEYFASKGVDAVYVGNPSVEEVRARLESLESQNDFRRRYGLSAKPLLALVPGSRRGEIRCNLPVMASVAQRHPDMQAVVAGAPGMDPSIYSAITGLPVIDGATLELMHYAEAALVTSGTATLECCLSGTPQVVCYRANGKRLSYNIMKHLIKTPYVSLPNLIAVRPVIPEMLVHLCTADSVDTELRAILHGEPGREKQLEGYRTVYGRLASQGAAATAARVIVTDLNELKNKA